MKLNNSYMLIGLISISIIYLFPLFSYDFIKTHDGENHLARFAAYINAFSDGQFPPRWAGNLNYGYGSPLFIFFYPLSGYIASFLYLFGINLETIFKIIVGSSFIFAPIFFFLWMKQRFSPIPSFIGALLYGFAPYHFLDMYVRGDIGELICFVFVPLVFLSIDSFNKKRKIILLLFGGGMYSFCILAHPIIALFFSPIFLLYSLFFSIGKDKKNNIFILLIGLLLSGFYWIPAFFESRYINSLYIDDWYKGHFPQLSSLIFSPWGFGSNVNDNGGLSPQIGLFHLGFIGIAFISLIRKWNTYVAFWIFTFIVSLLLMTNSSIVMYESIDLLEKIQFPWKFVSLASFSGAVVATYLCQRINKRVQIFIAVLFCIFTIQYVKFIPQERRNDAYYFSFKGTTFYHNEATTIWSEGDFFKDPRSRIEIISGKGMVKEIKSKSNSKELLVNTPSSITILYNMLYYPGWKIFADGQEIPIQFQDPNHRGIITFSLSKGIHVVQIEFEETKLRMFANGISIITIVVIISVLVYINHTKRIEKKYETKKYK